MKLAAKKYLLCPGHVKSQRDGQEHYISATRLAHLYGVNMADCVVESSLTLGQSTFDLIPLCPQEDGNYSLVVPPDIGEFKIPAIAAINWGPGRVFMPIAAGTPYAVCYGPDDFHAGWLVGAATMKKTDISLSQAEENVRIEAWIELQSDAQGQFILDATTVIQSRPSRDQPQTGFEDAW